MPDGPAETPYLSPSISEADNGDFPVVEFLPASYVEEQTLDQGAAISVDRRSGKVLNIDLCCRCGRSQVMVESLYERQHKVCWDCFKKFRTTAYRLVPQNRIPRGFGVSLDILKDKQNELIITLKPNPRSNFGPPMKLYYTFQIEELCAALHGSVEAWEAKKEERSSQAAKRRRTVGEV